jgi:hypothetical protein
MAGSPLKRARKLAGEARAKSEEERVARHRAHQRRVAKENSAANKRKRDPSRPYIVDYTEELGTEIIDRLCDGETVGQISRLDHMPVERTLRRWCRDTSLTLGKEYPNARAIGIDKLADELIELADSADAVNYNAVKLRLETRKWLLARLLSNTYGERTQHEIKAQVTTEAKLPSDRELARMLAAMANESGLGLEAVEPIKLLAEDTKKDAPEGAPES